MNNIKLVQYVEELIKHNELETAINQLMDFFQTQGISDYFNEVLLQSSKWNDLKQKINAGIITKEEIELQTNQIRTSILSLKDELKDLDEYNYEFKAINLVSIARKQQLKQHPKWIGAILLLLAVLSIAYVTQFSPKANGTPPVKETRTIPPVETLILDSNFDHGSSHYVSENDTIRIDPDDLAYIDHKKMFEFPSIEFRFKNNTEKEVWLSKYKLEIMELAVDVRPVLDFVWKKENNDIIVKVDNKGWGIAKNVDIRLLNDSLNQYIEGDVKTFNKEIQNFGTTVFSITTKKTSVHKFEYGQSIHEVDNEVQKLFENGEIALSVKYEDENGKVYKKEIKNINPFRHSPPNFETPADSMIYVHLLKPKKAKTKAKTYSLSRTINKVERFKIMIGSQISCKAKIRFHFEADGKMISSKPRVLEIWRPKGEQLYNGYRDGQSLKSKSTR